jgi:integrase
VVTDVVTGMLTLLQVKNAKPGRHSDTNGLHLVVKPSGTKSWVLRVQVNGNRKDIGLGSTASVNLGEVREKAAAIRKLIKEGRDPKEVRAASKAVLVTFIDAANRYHDDVSSSWKNEKHGKQWLATLKTYAYPVIGDMSVNDISAAYIYDILKPIWRDKAETARRVRQRIATVLNFSMAKGWRDSEAPNLAVGTLLRPLKQPARGHFSAMLYKEVPTFLAAMSAASATSGRLALQFALLTAARSGEARGACRSEFDLDARIWSLPASRMKGDRPHSVPLSAAAVAIVQRAMDRIDNSDDALLFPGKNGRVLSENTLGKVMASNGGGTHTVHGLRSSFRDWVAEGGVFSGDWAEAALAHTVSNAVEAAYKRTRYLEQRRPMMEAWAHYALSDSNFDQG